MMLTFQAAFEEEIDLIYQLYRRCAITPADELEDLKYSTALLHPLEFSRLAVDPQFQGRGYGKLLLEV